MNVTLKVIHNKFKLLLTLCLFLLTAACNTTYKQANVFYEQGNYVGAINAITADLDKSQKLPSDKMIAVIKSSIKQIEETIKQTLDTSYVEQIDNYEKLYKIKLLLEGKAYTKSFMAFHITHPIQTLNNKLTALHYQYGNSIKGTSVSDYKLRADTYKRGLEYGEYKDMRALAEETAKTYATLSAEQNYNSALMAINNKQYKVASEYLSKVISVHKLYGPYKDSNSLFAKYDPIWREQEAAMYFNQAQQLANTARRKLEHRQVSELYEKAYKIYSAYGDYKNSKALAEQEAIKGKIRVYYDDVRQSSFTFDNIANSALKDYFNSTGGTNWFTFTRRGSEDLYIGISYFGDVDDRREGPYSRTIKDNGVKFKEIEETEERTYTVNCEVVVGGNDQRNRRFSVAASSWVKRIHYEGNVPSNYREKKETYNVRFSDQLKSKSDLEDDVKGQFKQKLESILSDIKQQALNM